VHQLSAHHQVVIKELGRVQPVGTDAADVRRQVDDHIGSGVIQHARRVLHVDQVVLLDARDENVFRTALAQFFSHK
jgi:hypothetical protein